MDPKNKQFRSIHYDEPFAEKLINNRVISCLAFFAGTFALSAIYHSAMQEERVRGKFAKLIQGFSVMTSTDYLITFTIAVAVSALGVWIMNSMFNSRKIIVGLEFNAIDKKLKFRIRKLSDSDFYEVSIPYSEIKFHADKMSDGVSAPTDCFTFEHRGEVVGHFFKNHDMWSHIDEIEKEIYRN